MAFSLLVICLVELFPSLAFSVFCCFCLGSWATLWASSPTQVGSWRTWVGLWLFYRSRRGLTDSFVFCLLAFWKINYKPKIIWMDYFTCVPLDHSAAVALWFTFKSFIYIFWQMPTYNIYHNTVYIIKITDRKWMVKNCKITQKSKLWSVQLQTVLPFSETIFLKRGPTVLPVRRVIVRALFFLHSLKGRKTMTLHSVFIFFFLHRMAWWSSIHALNRQCGGGLHWVWVQAFTWDRHFIVAELSLKKWPDRKMSLQIYKSNCWLFKTHWPSSSVDRIRLMLPCMYWNV